MSGSPSQHGRLPEVDRTSRSAQIAGYLVLGAFVGTLGVWGAGASISGAVVAQGQFVVENNVKKVQHQQGGIVAELRARDGQAVGEGDLLIRLDDTLARANLQIIVRQIEEFVVRSARLEAERDQAAAVTIPESISTRMEGDPVVAAMAAAEERLFAIRKAALDGQRAQFSQRVLQLRAEIEGLTRQRAAKMREAEMIQRELSGVRDLFSRNLMQIGRLSQLEREAAALDGAQGQLTAQIAQVEGRIAETLLQSIQLTEERRSEAMKELREIQGKMGELLERRIAAEDQLKRVEIRAPASGIVHQMQTHTVGGVISAAEPAMLIVPTGELLHLDAQVATTDYDLVTLGQSAHIRLRAFNQRTTPELIGTVTRLAPDVVREQQTGLTYYVVRITVPQAELDRIAPLRVSAGMQADVFLATGERSPVSYLVKPVVDQFAKAFRER